MRLTRLLLPSAIALVVATGTAAAQATSQGAVYSGQGAAHGVDHPPAAAKGAEWGGDLPAHFEGITLTDAQRTRIAELQKEYHARMDAMRDSAKAAGTPADAPTLRAAIQRVMAEEHTAFRALLDDAGRARFDANMAKMHAAPQGAGHGAGQAAGHGTGHGAGHGAGHGPAGSTGQGGRPPR